MKFVPCFIRVDFPSKNLIKNEKIMFHVLNFLIYYYFRCICVYMCKCVCVIVCVHTCVCKHAHTIAQIWRSGDNFWGSISSFLHGLMRV